MGETRMPEEPEITGETTRETAEAERLDGPGTTGSMMAGVAESEEMQPGHRDFTAEEMDAPVDDVSELPELLDSGLGAGFVTNADDLGEAVGPPTVDPALPPESSTAGMPLFDEAAFLPPGPAAERNAPALAGERGSTKELLDMFVTSERLNALWHRADQASDLINGNVNSLDVARELLDQVQSARTLLLEKIENYEEAERAMSEVEYRIAYLDRTKEWSKSEAKKVAYYETVWATAFFLLGIYLLTTYFQGIYLVFREPENSFLSLTDMFISVGAILSGGLGGVLGAFYALWRYVSKQDFNPIYKIWYYLQPIMGMPIGLFIFLFVKVGFNVTAGAVDVNVGNPFIVFLLALMAGFQQNVVYSIVRQVLHLFKLDDAEDVKKEAK